MDLYLLMAGKVDGVDLQRNWIKYLGELPQREIPASIAACDVVTIPYANDPFNSMTGACKIAEYLACGKPVVATRVAGHEAMFNEAPASICDISPLGIMQAIKSQLKLRQVGNFPERLEWEAIGRELFRYMCFLLNPVNDP